MLLFTWNAHPFLITSFTLAVRGAGFCHSAKISLTGKVEFKASHQYSDSILRLSVVTLYTLHCNALLTTCFFYQVCIQVKEGLGAWHRALVFSKPLSKWNTHYGWSREWG